MKFNISREAKIGLVVVTAIFLLIYGLNFLKGKNILVTGGAVFIGSNIVETLLDYGAFVTVFDNLETGRYSNIEEFESNKNFQFIKVISVLLKNAN